MLNQFYFKQFSKGKYSFVFTELNVKTVLFQTIQFNISTHFKHTVKCKNSWFQTIQLA